jgi:hypothetical protein
MNIMRIKSSTNPSLLNPFQPDKLFQMQHFERARNQYSTPLFLQKQHPKGVRLRVYVEQFCFF